MPQSVTTGWTPRTMVNDFPLFPKAVSTVAPKIDQLYLFLVVISSVMILLIFSLIFYFAIKYRRTAANQVPVEYEPYVWMEWLWIIVPSGIFMVIFVWGAWIYFQVSRAPSDAMEVYVTAKQWMWKFQHLEGQSEINHLHVPVGRNVRLIMASEDTIHSFFVPEFRVHTDVLPHRYTINWFNARETGTYNLFCSEYCGTDHSGMIGKVTVMEPNEFETWLAGGKSTGAPAVEGKKLFEKFACNTCHTSDSTARGPVLTGLYGSPVSFNNGRTTTADENYIRESIVNPQAKIVTGFEPIMPTFQGQLNEAQVMQLVAYIKSLKVQLPATAPGEATGPAVPNTDPGTRPVSPNSTR